MNAAAVTIDPWLSSLLTEILKGVAIIVIPAFAAFIAGFVAKAINALAKKWGFEGVAVDQSNLETQAHAALKKGITDWLPLIEEKGWDSPEVKNAVLESATAYFQERFKDRVKEISAAAATPGSIINTTMSVEETLSARFPDAMALAAESPATPSAPKDPVQVITTTPTAPGNQP